MKKSLVGILSHIVALTLIIGVVPLAASADDDELSSGYSIEYFDYYENFFGFDAGTVTLDGVLAKLPAEIPATDTGGGTHSIPVTWHPLDWEIEDFDPDPDEFTEYIFIAELPGGFALGEHAALPQTSVVISVGEPATAAPLTYTISASPPTLVFGTLQSPYTQPAAQTVTITNTGTDAVTLTQPTATNYTIGALSTTNLPSNGSTATFTVRPNASLPASTHNETITITGSGGATTSVSASFTVTAAPTYTIGESPSPLDFGTLQSPYTQPAAQTVTITNTGTGAVTLTQPTAVDYDIGALSTTNLPTNGSTATFTVRPNAGLPASTYNETITIPGSNGASASVNVSFTVTAAPTCTISVSPPSPLDFGTLQSPYTQPAAQTVTITNTGTGEVTLNQPTAANYAIGALSTTNLPMNGSTATFTVKPNAGLPTGTYNQSIAITGSNVASTSVNVNFTVTAAPPPPVISTPPGALAGGTVGTAYNVTLAASNNPASWDLTGTLPTGLTFGTATGIISGTPGAAGTFGGLSVTAENSDGTSAPVVFSITVAKGAQAAPLGLNHADASAPGESDGTITGVNDTMEWMLSTAPAYTSVGGGLTTITGLAPGNYNVRYKETDNHNAGTAAHVTISYVGAPLTFTDNPDYDIPASTAGTAITPIDVHNSADGGTPPYTFSATGLPAGITISAAGIISGTPTVNAPAGTATITVTDNVSATASITIAYGAITSGTVTPPITPPVTPPATPPSSGNGGGSAATTTAAPAIMWITSPNTGGNPSRSTGQAGIRAGMWPRLGASPYRHDTVSGNAVQVRMTINNPSLFRSETMLSAYVTGAQVERTKTHFERWFSNNLQVVGFDQKGAFDAPVRIAAKIDLTRMDTENLVFYYFDSEANVCKRIENPAYSIDRNGYLWFDTPYGGNIIISDGRLQRK